MRVVRRGGSPQECARIAERDAGRCQRRRGSQEASGVEACKRVKGYCKTTECERSYAFMDRGAD